MTTQSTSTSACTRGLDAGGILEPGFEGAAGVLAISGVDEKSGVRLDARELERQLAVGRWYAAASRLLQSVNVVRHWIVSWILFRQPWDNSDWLSRSVRAPVMDYLDSLAYRKALGVAEDTEERLADMWGRVCEMWRDMNQAGICPEVLSYSVDDVEQLLDACTDLLGRDLDPGYQAASGRLVVTPLGLSPGVLYAVVRLLTPTHTVIISSAEAMVREAETLQAAGAPSLPRTVHVLDDPFDCFGQGSALARDPAMRDMFLRHEEVVFNITGGTTAMQYVIERLARESRALGVRTRSVALIDRRSPDVQKADPFVEGEMVWLEDLEDGRTAGVHS